jgi:LmbE family N-acetylglucosaminyl deacetylase
MKVNSNINVKTDESVLVICAHSDDQILGCGGTMAKLSKQGIDVHTIILSYGEKSHPHMKKEFVIKTRVNEAQEANEIIGGKKIYFLGLEEGHFKDDFEITNAEKKIQDIIDQNNVVKVFTHSETDLHADHIVTNKLVKKILKDKKKKVELYSFILWDLFKRTKKLSNSIKLIINISATFKIKLKALSKFKSQKMQMSLPYFQTQLFSIINGLKYGYKFAEIFIKEKI